MLTLKSPSLLWSVLSGGVTGCDVGQTVDANMMNFCSWWGVVVVGGGDDGLFIDE